MKTMLCCLVCLCLFLPVCAPASLAEASPAHEFLVLLSFGGTQNGGDEAAFIDAEGGVYYIDMAAEDLSWYGEETLAMLRSLPDTYQVAALNAQELQALQELIDGIQTVNTVEYLQSACDAGVFSQEVYRTAADGSREEILLMQAGDSIRENMDPNAIALSGKLLDIFSFTNRLRRWSYLFPYGDTVPLSLFFSRGSYFGSAREYALRREGDRLRYSIQGSNGDTTEESGEVKGFEGFELSTGVLGDLQRLITDQGLAAWDGFHESDDSILDGYGFSLTIDYGSHTIAASGYERYPQGYDQAARALDSFLSLLPARSEAAE